MASKLIFVSALGVMTLSMVACESLTFMTGRPEAVCEVLALGNGTVSGKATFTQEVDDILVEIDLGGLSPGKHGIHIHEHGDCSGLEGSAAGGHFDPTHRTHGMAAMQESHAGDLGNIVADANGHGRLSIKDKWIKLSGADGILGRSIIVHANADDLGSQPAGNSGARIACGLITAAKR